MAEEFTVEKILDQAKKMAAKTVAEKKAAHVSDKMQTDYSRFESIDDPDADPLAAAKRAKDSGNDFFKSELYESAIDAYTTALDDMPDWKKNENKATKALRINLHCNRAMCNMKVGNQELCIKDCDQALKSDRKALKALFRRAKANEAKKLYEKACKDILRLLHFDPPNKSANKYLTKLKKKVHSRSLSAIRSAVQREENKLLEKKKERDRKKAKNKAKSAETETSSSSTPSKPKASRASSEPDKLSKEDEQELSKISKKGYCHFRSDTDSASRNIIGDIRPKKISSGSPAPALPKAKTKVVVGSQWNNGGTWEEKDTTKQATARLKELLKGLTWGAAECTKLNKVEGTANFGHSRKGNFFLFEYRLEMEVKVAHSSGSDNKFKLTFPDVSSVVMDDEDDTLDMDVSVMSGKKDAECLSALDAIKFQVDRAITTFAEEFIAQIK